MKITESLLSDMIYEALNEYINEEDELNEGKFSKTLGTLALGGALMFGNGNNINAQNNQIYNNNKTITQTQQYQNTEGFKFYCSRFKNDYNRIVNYANQEFWKENAMQILSEFPLDKNGAIHLEYIITCNENYDMKQVMETSYDYFNYVFSSADATVKRYDIENGIITARGFYSNIGQSNLNAIYYVKLVRISAYTDIILRFKDNKIKIDVIIRNYKMVSGESTMRSENLLVSVNDVYPANPESNNKIAYATAFVNSYYYSIDKVKKYIEFLNNNVDDSEIYNDDAAWEIEDRGEYNNAKDKWDFNTPEKLKTRYFQIQQQIQHNKKLLKKVEKNSKEELKLKEQSESLRKEMQQIYQEYIKLTGKSFHDTDY